MSSHARAAEAASLLVAARRAGTRLAALPESCGPASLAEAEAIQDATLAALGERPGAWKVGRNEGNLFTAPIPTGAVQEASAAPLRLPRGTRIELELALRFRAATPLASLPMEALPGLCDLVLLYEIVVARIDEAAGSLQRIADCLANHLVVVGPPTGAWGWEEVERPRARLELDGAEIGALDGGHPALPLAPLLEAWRARRAPMGAAAGEIVTLGSLTGAPFVPDAGGRYRGEVAGRGALALEISVD